MKVSTQAALIRYTLELSPDELNDLRKELKLLKQHEKSAATLLSTEETMEEAEEVCPVRFPYITALVDEVSQA